MYLFFDTETTGLPKNWSAPVTDTANWPRIIQLAFALFNEEQECVFKYCELIKPEGWTMPTDKFWTDHGYSHEKSEREGVPIIAAILEIKAAIEKCEFIIAHNINFDQKIVGAEFIRLGMKAEKQPVKICTMTSSTDICRIPNAKGNGYKWPKLEELHKYLFNKGFDGAHDAMNDVMACANCFFKLKNIRAIK